MEQSNKCKVSWDHLEYREYVVYANGQPFTGIAEEYLGADYLYSETEFVDGLQHGISRVYSETKQPLHEKTIYQGVAHGVQREWFDSGKLASVAIYDHGYCLQRTKWDENGTEIERYQLSQSHSDYTMLERYRLRNSDWPEVSENDTADE